ncbi:MAG: 3D domain-containing protein [bacterium]
MRLLRFVAFSILIVLLVLPLVVTARDEVVEIKVIEGETRQTVITGARTVGEYLNEEGLKETDFRRIFPALSSELREGTHLFLFPSHEKAGSNNKIIPDERIISTRSLGAGEKLVIRGGRSGVKADGRVVEKALPRLVLEGQVEFKNARRRKLKEKGIIRLEATGYSPHALDTAPYDDGFSALGLPAGYGLAAVDPRIIPLGTLLYVEGYGYAVAADVGGAIKGHRIDLCFPERSHALNYGRQWAKVHIIG